jgi:hypothetical protein
MFIDAGQQYRQFQHRTPNGVPTPQRLVAYKHVPLRNEERHSRERGKWLFANNDATLARPMLLKTSCHKEKENEK